LDLFLEQEAAAVLPTAADTDETDNGYTVSKTRYSASTQGPRWHAVN